ncbi:membrane protein [Parapedobacter defluvii]|uniref:Membrane protein n=2 Tax=Parapedobacter defluvii TaxID=2045106 RepID=A0ABQ1MAS8_9SPHI|nr:membrane protein [Parapedobacter defluvii]
MDAWQGYYGFIRDCNTFFEHIDAVEGDEALKERLIGEMRFIRAWCYFDLISRYGGVPLITKVYSLSDDDYLVSRNSYDECMDFIIKELDEAAETLPVSYSGADIGRITKGAVLSLKSRALLYAASPLNNPANDRSKWLDAVDAAKAVVDLDAYTLYEGADYKQIFLEKFNPEVILSFNINATRNPSGSFESRLNVLIGPNGHHGWSAYTPSQSLVDQFPMKNGKMITEEGSGYDENNPYENRDPRFYADILYNGAEFRGRPYESFVGGLDSPQSPVENWNASLTGYNWRKYSNDALPIDENIGTDQNWIIFRYAEIYLNYAEAAYETGDEATARKYLNLVRSRTSVGMPDVTASGNELSEAIKLERQIELCFEGHRFFDVRRWKIAMETENRPLRGVTIEKKPSGGFSYSYFILQDRKFEERNYWYPIPKYEMDKNENLEQNPQY